MFLYDFALMPDDSELLEKTCAASARLARKLAAIKIEDLRISDYNKKYFGKYIEKLQGTLQLYNYLVIWALASHKIPLKNIVAIDYGGGSGLCSMLLKELGVGKVVYTDIYDVSSKDAQEIARTVDLAADYYVTGDIDDLVRFTAEQDLPCHSVISFNVIEHVYVIETFLTKVCGLAQGPCSLVLGSSANTFNPRTRRLTMKVHRERETRRIEKTWGHKERDTLQSYREARREIVQSEFPRLRMKEVDELARRTRGLVKSDILKAVSSYATTGVMLAEPAHPTNTCDPYTGNWAEHLMDPFRLREVLANEGFDGEVRAGYYPPYGTLMKNALTRLLNGAIAHSGPIGLRLAPCYLLTARNFGQ